MKTALFRLPALFSLAVAVLLLAGCATPSVLPSLDVSGPGWKTWEGQAVWENRFDKNPLIGEFVTGVSQSEGVRFAELSKGGIPIVRARRTAEKWEIQFVPMNLAQKGKGTNVSKKWIFLHLPDIMAGANPPEGWSVERAKDRVILTNPKLKERLELMVESGPR